jgi:hypothetical protein
MELPLAVAYLKAHFKPPITALTCDDSKQLACLTLRDNVGTSRFTFSFTSMKPKSFSNKALAKQLRRQLVFGFASARTTTKTKTIFFLLFQHSHLEQLDNYKLILIYCSNMYIQKTIHKCVRSETACLCVHSLRKSIHET